MLNLSERIARGARIAQLHAGIWRADSVPVAITANELEQLKPHILRSRSGALVWQRFGMGAQPLRDQAWLLEEYQLAHLLDAVFTQGLQRILPLLRAASIEPIVAKGWSIARHYAQPALRGYGDIDLWVPPSDFAKAAQILAEVEDLGRLVDLHQSFAELADRSPEGLLARSRLIPCGDTNVRLLGLEDHLRLVCLHVLRHGAPRVLWLCDVGAILDALPPDFDWNYCLTGDYWRTRWVISILVLAHVLVGADLRHTPPIVQAFRLPRWLVPLTLREWGSTEMPLPARPLVSYLRNPQGVVRAIRDRWSNGLVATYFFRVAPNERARLLYQIQFANERPRLLYQIRHSLPRLRKEIESALFASRADSG